MAVAQPGDSRITHVDQACRLKLFCKLHYRDILHSKKGCICAISRGDISVNDVPATDPSQLLAVGDIVQLKINCAAIMEAQDSIPLEVIFEDDSMAVVWKPSGMVPRGRDTQTLALALPHALSWQNDEDRSPHIVNCLPRSMAGLTLVTKTDQAFQTLQQNIQEGKVKCKYRLVAQGRAPPGCCIGATLDLARDYDADEKEQEPQARATDSGIDESTSGTLLILKEGLPVGHPEGCGKIRWRRRRKRQQKQQQRRDGTEQDDSQTKQEDTDLHAVVVNITPSNTVGRLLTLDILCNDPSQGLLHGSLRRQLLGHGLSIIGTRDSVQVSAAKQGLQKQKFFCTKGLYMALIDIAFDHPTLGTSVSLSHAPPDKFDTLVQREAAAYFRKRHGLCQASATAPQDSGKPIAIDFLLHARVPGEAWTSSADTPNRHRDKQFIETVWRLPEFGCKIPVFFCLRNGTALASGYQRVLYGDHGPYVEFSRDNINFDQWFKNTNKQHPDRFYDEWFADDGQVVLYDQLRSVHGQHCPPAGRRAANNFRPEGYADYRVGYLYLELTDHLMLTSDGET